MDELFDKIKGSASKVKDGAERVASVVAKQTTKAITHTKLSFSINETNNKIKELYVQIGKDTYKKYLDGDATDPDFADALAKIDVLKRDVTILKEKKAELKNLVHCANCGAANPVDADFCSKCGAALEVADDVDDVDDVDDDETYDDEITITPQPNE